MRVVTRSRGFIRRDRGAYIAEAGAAMSLFIPLTVLIIFVVVETASAFYLKAILSEAARSAARNMAVAYGQDPTIATSRSLQDAMVFDYVRYANVVAASPQFDNPQFNTASVPHTVSVTVRYLSNQYGLPPFPNPDPLNLGSQFVLTGASTYRLE